MYVHFMSDSSTQGNIRDVPSGIYNIQVKRHLRVKSHVSAAKPVVTLSVFHVTVLICTLILSELSEG